jgi:hypothetical protein
VYPGSHRYSLLDAGLAGTLANGEKRLLFSSAQVEYVRYWLHAMQITDQPIPIPHSECLLTDAHLRLVSPVVFKTGGELKTATKASDFVLVECTKNKFPPILGDPKI